MKNTTLLSILFLLLVSCQQDKIDNKVSSKSNDKTTVVTQDKNSTNIDKASRQETQIKTEPTQKIVKDSTLTIAYNGADLGYLDNKHYGNKAYRNVLSAYNNFEDKRSVDKKYDVLKIPQLSDLSNSAAFPKLSLISDELAKIIEAREIYLKQEHILWDLPKDTENRNFRQVPQAQKLELLGAAKRMYESIEGLKQQENIPQKAIGQFRQVAENLENIAQGKIDENGYALDMVEQRLAHGFANCIRWAKEDY